MELPKTSAMVGMPSADSSVRSWKICPAGTNRSDWVGRSAPPDSTRLISGSRFTRAISSARRFLRSVYGFIEPPRTVGSCPMITHSTPDTTPIPVTMLAPTVNSVPHAASEDSSRNGLSRSSSSSIRSRTSSRPRDRCRSAYRGPPPARASGQLLVQFGQHGQLGCRGCAGRPLAGSTADVSTGMVAGYS